MERQEMMLNIECTKTIMEIAKRIKSCTVQVLSYTTGQHKNICGLWWVITLFERGGEWRVML